MASTARRSRCCGANSKHRRSVAARAATAADAAPGSRLTHLGFTVSTPRVDGDGAIWFSASSPHGFPGLYRLRAGRLERVVNRYGGGGPRRPRCRRLRPAGVRPRRRPLEQSLRVRARTPGQCNGSRVKRASWIPTSSPDGTRLAVVCTRPAGRELLVLDATKVLSARTPIGAAGLPIVARLGDDGDVFAMPRWSPDGCRLAVERSPASRPVEIAVLHADLSDAMPPISSRGRNTTPERLDGGRRPGGVCLRSRRRSVCFVQCVAVAKASQMKVLAPAGGAVSPAAAADGLVFVGYTVAGSDLFACGPNNPNRNPHPTMQSTSNQPPKIHSPQPTILNPQPRIAVADIRASRLAAVRRTA